MTSPNGSLSMALEHADDDEASQKLSFEEAKRHFSMYGKRHDHVSHLADDLDQPLATDPSNSSVLATDTTPSRRRPLPSTKATSEQEEKPSTQLKNTLLLQENGELAIQLDEINYHIDGLVAPLKTTATATLGTTSTSISTTIPIGCKTDIRDPVVDAQSVLELILLLQKPEIQSVLRVSNHFDRLREVILLLGDAQDPIFSLSLAALTFFLTKNQENLEREDFVSDQLLQVLTMCFQRAIKPSATHADATGNGKITKSSDAETPHKPATTKTYLKRKKKRRSINGLPEGDDEESQESSTNNLPIDPRVTTIRQQLDSLLVKEEAFRLDGEMCNVTLVELLLMVFCHVLQIDDQQNSPREGRVALSFRSNQLAKETFHRVLTRKIYLIKCGALDAFLTLFESRADEVLPHIPKLLAPTSLKVAVCFQRLRNLLKVLDQVSFLAAKVQQFLASHSMLFFKLFRLIDQLSSVLWNTKHQWKWQQDETLAALASEVLLACCRVVINLTHHNKIAAQHVFKADGTRVLFDAFARMWMLCQSTGGKASKDILEEKSVFDGLLLTLSALMNVIELSERNRVALCQLEVTSQQSAAFGTAKQDVCSLLVAFFQSQIASFEQFLVKDDHDSITMGEASAPMDSNWNPEDVILGGATSLLLGCLMQQSPDKILEGLPSKSPRLLLQCLSAFVALHSQLGALTPEVGKSVLQVERTLKSFLPASEQSTALRQVPELSPAEGHESQGLADDGDLYESPVQSQMLSQSQSLSFPSGASQDHDEESLEMELEQLETMRQQILDRKKAIDAKKSRLNTPPASAFRMKRPLKNVCSSGSMSDSMDSVDEDEEDESSSVTSESRRHKRRFFKRKRTWKNSLIFSQEDEAEIKQADGQEDNEPSESQSISQEDVSMGISGDSLTQDKKLKSTVVDHEEVGPPAAKRTRTSNQTSSDVANTAATRPRESKSNSKSTVKVVEETSKAAKAPVETRKSSPSPEPCVVVNRQTPKRSTSVLEKKGLPVTPRTKAMQRSASLPSSTPRRASPRATTQATPSPRPKSASLVPPARGTATTPAARRKAKPKAKMDKKKPKPPQRSAKDVDDEDVFEFTG